MRAATCIFQELRVATLVGLLSANKTPSKGGTLNRDCPALSPLVIIPDQDRRSLFNYANQLKRNPIAGDDAVSGN
jgi:hypothetical protein